MNKDLLQKAKLIDKAANASYTEFLKDYLQDNQLPALFDEVPSISQSQNVESFKDIFIKHFNLREIGFYTEEEFASRIAERASVVIPFYNDLIAQYVYTNSHLFETTYTQTEQSADASAYTRNLAETENADTSDANVMNRDRKTQKCPLGTSVATFSNDNVDEASQENGTDTRTVGTDITRGYTGTDNRSNTGNRTIVFTGNLGRTPNIAIYKEFEQLKNLYTRLLNEFDDLFIQIW